MRIANRLLAFLVAVALVGTGVIVIVEVVAVRSDTAPLIIQWHAILRWGQRNTWRATSVELASAITAGGGLVLLVPQLLRRRLSRLTMDAADPTDATDAAITRKGIAVALRGAVADVDGVSGSRVKVGHRHIRVNALSPADAPAAGSAAASTEPEMAGSLAIRVEGAAAQQLESLRLRPPRRLRVAVNGRRTGGR